MTKEQEDIVARYMDWKWESEEWDMMYKVREGFWYSEDDRWEDCGIEIYYEDWNALMTLLQKLLPELKEQQKIAGSMADDVTLGHLEGLIGCIEMALLELDIIKIFNAVVEAIIQLNKLKENGEESNYRP